MFRVQCAQHQEVKFVLHLVSGIITPKHRVKSKYHVLQTRANFTSVSPVLPNRYCDHIKSRFTHKETK